MFYDIHNHILPGIDDGAPDIESALCMAKAAIEDGVTHIVCTPHIHYGRYNNTLESINAALQALENALAQNNLYLQVAAAAEVRICPELFNAVTEGNLPFLGDYDNKKALLLEFPSDTIPLGTEKLTKWLLDRDIIPVIAHPERNSVFQTHPERIDLFLNQGCLTQITAGSFLGNFGHKAQKTAQAFLDAKKIHIVASDAHNIKYRPPLLSESYNHVTESAGEQIAKQLFITTPRDIVASKFSQGRVS